MGDLASEVMAEFASASRRGREWFDAEAYSLTRPAKRKADAEFARQCAVWRAAKWIREHPERRREYMKAYRDTDEHRAYEREYKRRYLAAKRAKRLAERLVCVECGAEFRRKNCGRKPRLCSHACQVRNGNHRRNPAAVRRSLRKPRGEAVRG